MSINGMARMSRRIGAKNPTFGLGFGLIQEWAKGLNCVTIEGSTIERFVSQARRLGVSPHFDFSYLTVCGVRLAPRGWSREQFFTRGKGSNHHHMVHTNKRMREGELKWTFVQKETSPRGWIEWPLLRQETQLAEQAVCKVRARCAIGRPRTLDPLEAAATFARVTGDN